MSVVSGGAHEMPSVPGAGSDRRAAAQRGFCADCFTRHCREQVRRGIEDHDMIHEGDRVLVAVSGGKDSLGLWQLLRELGYEADGLYVGLGIGSYSDRSGDFARAFAKEHDWPLLEIDLQDTYGFDVPGGARRPSASLFRVRTLEAPRLQRRGALERLRHPGDGTQPRRRSGGAPRQRAALGGGLPRPPASRCCPRRRASSAR